MVCFQWEFVPLGEAFAVHSLKNSTRMCVEGEAVENAAVLRSKLPVAWDVEVVESSEEDEDVVVRYVDISGPCSLADPN